MATLEQAKQSEQALQSEPDKLLFLRFTGAALLVMFLFSPWAISYKSEHVSLHRYCENPQNTLRLLEQVLRESRPAGDGSRRPHIVAAKLLYLVPRKKQEIESTYLNRVRRHIESSCR